MPCPKHHSWHVSTPPLHLLSSSVQIHHHADLVTKIHADSIFNTDSAIGVFDGYDLAHSQYDPKGYASVIKSKTKEYIESKPSTKAIDAVNDALLNGPETGQTTVSVYKVEGTTLNGIMYGTSRLFIFRKEQIVYKTKRMLSQDRKPARIGYKDRDKLSSGQTVNFNLQEDDIIIAASDGLWNNVKTSELSEIISNQLVHWEIPKALEERYKAIEAFFKGNTDVEDIIGDLDAAKKTTTLAKTLAKKALQNIHSPSAESRSYDNISIIVAMATSGSSHLCTSWTGICPICKNHHTAHRNYHHDDKQHYHPPKHQHTRHGHCHSPKESHHCPHKPPNLPPKDSHYPEHQHTPQGCFHSPKESHHCPHKPPNPPPKDSHYPEHQPTPKKSHHCPHKPPNPPPEHSHHPQKSHCHLKHAHHSPEHCNPRRKCHYLPEHPDHHDKYSHPEEKTHHCPEQHTHPPVEHYCPSHKVYKHPRKYPDPPQDHCHTHNKTHHRDHKCPNSPHKDCNKHQTKHHELDHNCCRHHQHHQGNCKDHHASYHYQYHQYHNRHHHHRRHHRHRRHREHREHHYHYHH